MREGLEAILIIGALLTFLAKTGAQDRKRDIHVGVGAAVLASLFTAVLLETVFQVTPARREVLEGAVMLTASAVLFYVSYWLLSKIEVARWNQFVKSQVQDAVTSGSALALATAAFLAVYREGFETVLFYKALVLAGPAGSTFVPVTAGIALGSLVLVAVYYAINRFGVRLPLKPFFAVTGLFLYYMAFLFAGRGIAELQEGGVDRDHGAAVGAADPGARHLSHGRVTAGAGRTCWRCCWARWCGASCWHRCAPCESHGDARAVAANARAGGAYGGSGRGGGASTDLAGHAPGSGAFARADGGRPGRAPRRGGADARPAAEGPGRRRGSSSRYWRQGAFGSPLGPLSAGRWSALPIRIAASNTSWVTRAMLT